MFKILHNDLRAYAFITVVASLIFIPFIGNMPLFDWDEINFAECAREMVVSHNYSDVQLYFRSFWEKPPLFIWLQAISMNVFGVNEFAARLPNALCGVSTLLVLYKTGKTLNDRKFGLTWALVYAGTLLPHLFFKSGIIDPWFNLFIYLAVFNLIQHTNNPVGKFGFKTALYAGFFLGLALLTKGPAALILLSITVALFFVLNRFRKISTPAFLSVFFLSFLITGLSWFAIELAKGNGHVIKEFIDYQVRLFKTEDADHGGPFFYHFIVLLIGCFPSSLLLILAHKKSGFDTPFQKHSKLWMFCLFWVVLILFSIVKTKIVHYSSMCYFPLTYLATYAIQKLQTREFAWRRWLQVFFVVIASVMGLAFTIVGCFPLFKSWLIQSDLIADRFAVENLKTEVHWNGFEWLIGVLFLSLTLYCLFKIKRGHLTFIYALFLVSLLSTYSLIMVLTPKVEQYTQRTAIEFYKMCAKNHFYVESVGFKSYGTLFYGGLDTSVKTNPEFLAYQKRKAPELEARGIDVSVSFSLMRTLWLQEGITDRPSCLVLKIMDEEVVKGNPSLKELYRKNGFIFYLRNPTKQ